MNKLLIFIIAGLALGACSVKRTAVNIIGDALSGGGGLYASDGDPDLIRDGMNLFLASYRFDEPLLRVYRSAVPFLFILLGVVLLVTYVPGLIIGVGGGG